MKIPRLVRRKPAFKRRSSPPPAARKLLIASLASGLVLLAMLAIVFIPRGLPYEPLPILPRIEFTWTVTAGLTHVVVAEVTIVRPLSEYNATYSSGTTILGSVNPLNGTPSGSLVFQDMDSDGTLSVGDEFRVTYTAVEVLRVGFLPGDAIVGHWPSPP